MVSFMGNYMYMYIQGWDMLESIIEANLTAANGGLKTLSQLLPQDNTGDYVVIQKWISEEMTNAQHQF